MSVQQNKKANQVKIARLDIIAQLYKRGWAVRAIRTEVMKRLDLKTLSTGTVSRDIKTLLAEWRESRIENTDEALQLELERIDDTVRELWDQWEKSKTNYTKTSRKQKGSPRRDEQTGTTQIHTFATERTETEVIRLGDPSYISEIRMQLAELRKLLGLYAPEKKDVSGNISFAQLLVESGMLNEAEQSLEE